MTLPCKSERQRGMVLITAMLLLVVVTIMALSMFRSYGMQERIAGNTREKQRALNAAISADQYAEYWLASSPPPTPAPCNSVVNSTVGQICSNPLANPASLPWPAGITYTQFTSNAINNVSNTVSTTGTAGSYYQAPVYYIADLGAATDAATGNSGELYQIDAVGYGGTATAVAVVESTYLLSPNGPQNIGGP